MTAGWRIIKEGRQENWERYISSPPSGLLSWAFYLLEVPHEEVSCRTHVLTAKGSNTPTNHRVGDALAMQTHNTSWAFMRSTHPNSSHPEPQNHAEKSHFFFWSSSQWPVWHQTLQDCCRSCLCSSRVPVEDPYQTEWAETHQERRVTNATARHWFENCLDQQTEGTSYVTSLSGRGKKTNTHTLGNRFSVSAVSQTLCL